MSWISHRFLTASRPPLRPTSEAVEIEFWDSIKNSVSASEYEAYLEQYPEGSFAALARVRLRKRSPKTLSACATLKTGKSNCRFGNLSARAKTPALIEAYLEKYPNGEFTALAEIRPRRAQGQRNIVT